MARNALLIGLAITTTSVMAADAGYYNSSDCIDPGGFSSCYSDANSSYTECLNSSCKSKDMDCINACECVRSSNYIDCAASSCWNQVYSCEYQLTVSDYINYCAAEDLDTIPFWPPLDNAPTGCSCPIGKLQYSILSDVGHLDACTNNQTNLDKMPSGDDIANYGEACTCCYLSGILSAIYDICPSTIPSILGADTYFSSLFTDTDWESCGTYLKAYDCTSELGFSSPAGNVTNYYGPKNFPKNGTLNLFDTKGEGEIRTPASGSVFTWTANGVARTVSAVGVTGTMSERSSATTVQTPSGTRATATSTPSSTGAASIFEVGLWRLWVVFGVLLII